MQQIPQNGDIYRHFTNKLYQILTIAKHSETNEDMVIYQALYGTFETYVRPLSSFLSKVDNTKYPNATQTYRFEKVERKELCKSEADSSESSITNTIPTAPVVASQENEEDLSGVNPHLLAILDTDTYEEKYKLLCDLRSDIDDRLVNDLSVALDIAVDNGPVDKRYEQLKSALATLCKYEVHRLR